MDRNVLISKIHTLVIKTFKNTKIGYCWIDAKFGSLLWEDMTDMQLKEIVLCIASKRDLKECPIHLRIHSSKRNRVK